MICEVCDEQYGEFRIRNNVCVCINCSERYDELKQQRIDKKLKEILDKEATKK